MRLAAVLIPPSLDAKQALRLRRFGFAALSYALAAALVAVIWAFGVLPAVDALEVAAAYLAINLGLYGVIRSGFNLRFEDPSLTRFQILTAITVLMYVVYHMDDGRNAALFGCFIVFLFGIFRLNARDFTVVTLYTLAAYALVISLLMHLRPQAIHDVPLEWMSWLALAGFLPCFAIVGGHINTLRRKLHESEVRFRGLTEMSSDWYWEQDRELRLSFHSSSFAQHSGTTSNKLLGKCRWEEPNRFPLSGTWAEHRATLEAHEPFQNFEYVRTGDDGKQYFVSLSGVPIFDAAGKFNGYRGVGTNITKRKQAEQALRASAQELRLFANNVPTMTAAWDEHLRCRFANKRYCDFYGFTVDSILGKHMREVVGEEAYREIEGHFARVLQGQSVAFQRICKLANDESRYLEVKLIPHRGEQGQTLGCFAVTTDITDYKLTEERIQRVAHHDSLTGLPNRLLFNDRLQQAINLAKRDARQFALLYLDLDRFKRVNDRLGHTAGDELLQAVASRIRCEVRESDTVARIGGDEFTVILSNVAGREEAQTVANKIIAAVAAPFLIGSQQQSVEIGTSIGISLYPTDGQDADTLVNASDAAMYGAKQVGGSFRFET